ncbi:CYTH domain-containing protein [Akkermansiaceae bacterium]|nr:CYTH domain-containing protein [Akkermansiaceae bacterium]
MAKEIEHKFLVRSDDWKATSTEGKIYRQAYMASNPTVRIRIVDETTGILTLKTKIVGITREEFEYEVPLEDAQVMMASFTSGEIVEKRRHLCVVGGKTWEIDVFSGSNEGLIVAELELQSEDEPFELPEWVGECVTGDSRYSNSSLSQNPFCSWE